MFDKKMTRRAFVGGAVGVCLTGPTVLKGFARGDTSGPAFLPIRKRLPNPYVENGRPIVVVVRGTDFPAMLARGMETLGGFIRFGNHRSVIVKPNFVFDRRSVYPTTTDENSVLTTVEFLQKEGFKHITVADRRGRKTKGRAGGKFDWSGLNDKADAGGFKTDSLLDDGEAETVFVKDARFANMPHIGVIKKIYDAELIINMPTIKRHFQTNLTCALKNNMGVLDVPTTDDMHLYGDKNKAAAESMTQDEVSRRLCLTIAEAAAAVNPEVTVIDARTVLCKNHVSVAEGEPRAANRLIISGDPLAADIVAAKVLKEVYESYELGCTRDTFEYAAQLQIGVGSESGILMKEVGV